MLRGDVGEEGKPSEKSRRYKVVLLLVSFVFAKKQGDSSPREKRESYTSC